MDGPQLNDIVREIEVQYLPAGEWAIKPGELNYTLYFIRSGAVETHSKEQTLIRRMDAGELFGYASCTTFPLVGF